MARKDVPMGLSKTIWSKPAEYLSQCRPQAPVMFFAPGILHDTARRFIDGFPGLVSYAVSSNPQDVVIENLAAAGLRGFDVISRAEMLLIRRLAPEAAIHCATPIRRRSEIAAAVALGLRSYTVDNASDLTRLIDLVPARGAGISVRVRVPQPGAAADAGAGFGGSPDLAAGLLRRIATAGFAPSLTCQPDARSTDPTVWETHIRTAAEIAGAAGVTLARLNLCGTFPADRLNGSDRDTDTIFGRIDKAAAVFGASRPLLVCNPGGAMVADSFALAARIPTVGDDRTLPAPDGAALSAQAPLCAGASRQSVERLPGASGDYVLFRGMGAGPASTTACGRPYGDAGIETVLSLG